MRLSIALIFALAFASTLSATLTTMSADGTFSNATPSSAFSGPDDTWSFSFQINTNPVVSDVDAGQAFDAAVTNFVYLLNGVATTATLADVRFFNSSVDGGFSICFSPPCVSIDYPTNGLSTTGQQMYTGSELSPTMLNNYTFTSATFVVCVNNFPVGSVCPNSEPDMEVDVGSPEPSSWLLIGGGFLMLGSLRRYWLAVTRWGIKGNSYRDSPLDLAGLRSRCRQPGLQTSRRGV
jgi:hypothetical protein